MEFDLDLNESHEAAILNCMRFARYQRAQCLKTIKLCFQDIKDTRLTDETYTCEEVDEIISYLAEQVNVEIESELLNASHTNIILLRQLFQQAEHWHLKLQADISQLENSDLLNKIKLFEEQKLIGNQQEKKSSSPVKTKLEPLNENGGSVLLQMKITQLTEENEQLRERIKQTETKAVSLLNEKSALSDELQNLKLEMKTAETAPVEIREKSDDVTVLQEKLKELQSKLTDTETMSRQQEGIEDDLIKTKHRLLEVQAQMELTEKELEKKFSQTAAYVNLKKMLTKKNEQIKELRKRLVVYEPASNQNDD